MHKANTDDGSQVDGHLSDAQGHAVPERDEPINLMDRAGHEMERRTIRTSSGVGLAYAEGGTGPPVVLLHGTLTTLEDMALSLFDELTPNFRAIAFDRPGFGRSEVRRFADAGIWRQAEQIHEAVDQLGLDRPVVVGHSFGASVAIAMAVARPEAIGGVVALAPLVWPEARLEHLLFGVRAPALLGELIGLGAQAGGDRVLLPMLYRGMYLPQPIPPLILRDFPFALAGRTEATLRVGEDSFNALPDLLRTLASCARCTVPVRVFGGQHDVVVRNALHGRLLPHLMPDATFTELPGLGHMVHHFAASEIAQAVDGLTDAWRPRPST